MSQRPIVILRQITGGSITQCQFISKSYHSLRDMNHNEIDTNVDSTPYHTSVENSEQYSLSQNMKHSKRYAVDMLLTSSNNQISLFDLKTRRVAMKIFTSHDASILSCALVMGGSPNTMDSKINDFTLDPNQMATYILSWSRDGSLECNQIDLMGMKHIGTTHRFKIGKEASFCKWGIDIPKQSGWDMKTIIYLPHENEEDVLEIEFQRGVFKVVNTYHPFIQHTSWRLDEFENALNVKPSIDNSFENNDKFNIDNNKIQKEDDKRGMLMSISLTPRFLICGWESGRISFLLRASTSKTELYHLSSVNNEDSPPEPITEIKAFSVVLDSKDLCKMWKNQLFDSSRDEDSFHYENQYKEKCLENNEDQCQTIQGQNCKKVLHLLAVGSSGSVINIYNRLSQELVTQFQLPFKGGVNHFVFSSNRFLLAAGWDFRIHIWDIKRLKPLGALKFHTDSVNCLSILREDEYLSTEIENRYMDENEKYIRCTQKHDIIVCSASNDNRIAVWKLNFQRKSRK